MSNIIELDHINVTFKRNKQTVNAVNDVSLHIKKGDIYGIVGYSGAGKSTLVRTINLLQKPTAGKVVVNGDVFFDKTNDGKAVQISAKKLRQKRRNIGMIFQRFNLLNEQTVIENVEFALLHSDLDDDAVEKKAKELLDLVGLSHRINAYPAELSGGEQQRVAIARALANDPEILISDESTSALDPKNTLQILDLLKDLNKKLNVTVVLITHEMEAVKRIANKVAVMEHGQIIEAGSIQDVFVNPKQQLTREFVGGALQAIDTLKLFNLDQLGDNQELIQLTFTGTDITEPVSLALYKRFGVETNILYSNIEALGDVPVGTLFVSLKGDSDARKQALAFLDEKNIQVTKIDTEVLL